MSFKIFSLQLLGKIKSVESIEKRRKDLKASYDEFCSAEKSGELKRYLELESNLASDEFKRKKSDIQSLKFKGSEEFNQLHEFQKLQKNRSLKRYFQVEGAGDLSKFLDIQKSDKLKEYYQLLDYVKEGQFQKDKREIVSQVFKGSVEQKHLLELKKLARSRGIKAFLELNESSQLQSHEEFGDSDKLKKFNELKNSTDKKDRSELLKLKRDTAIKSYFRFERSKKLRLYHETKTSHDLKRYQELKEFAGSPELQERVSFLKDKKKFEKSEAWQKLQQFNRLKADADIKFALKYEKSALYKNYLDVRESFQLKRFSELQEMIKSDEYKERKAYLEDPKKWEKTEEHGFELEFAKLKDVPMLKTYFKHKDTSIFDELIKWETAFKDDFKGPDLNESNWSTITRIASQSLGENYALAGDLNINNNGKNLSLQNKLTLAVKREKATGKTWQMPAGFVPSEFDYTSDLISTWKSFGLEDGKMEAKIRFAPHKEVLSSIYLVGEKEMPRINLLQMGAKNMLGISSLNTNGKLDQNGLDISNLKSGRWYLFSLNKKGAELQWKINETEVLRLNSSDFSSALSLNVSSLVVEELKGKSSCAFEIEWIRCSRERNN